MGHDTPLFCRICTFPEDRSTFKMLVSPLMTIGEIKNSMMMRNFFQESNVELLVNRLSAIRHGRICSDSDTIDILQICENEILDFTYPKTVVATPSPAVATPSPVVATPSPAVATTKSSFLDFEPDIWQCGIFSCAPVAPVLSAENRERAIAMLASVGNEARSTTSADTFEVTPNVSSLPNILNGVPVTPETYPEVHQPPKPMTTLSQFITQAQSPEIVNPETAGPVLLNFLASTTAICNVLDGKTTNSTIESTLKDLLRQLIAMQSKISSRNELASLLEPITAQIQEAEPIIRAMNAEFERIMTGNGIGIWEHMKALCIQYDSMLKLLADRTKLVISYSNKYQGFENPAQDIQAYLDKIDKVEAELRASTTACQAYLQRLRINLHDFDISTADALARNHDLEQQVQAELEKRASQASQTVIRLLEVLKDEMQRATEIKVLEEKLKQIQQTRADIIAHADSSHKRLEETQETLEFKCQDNDLCVSQVQNFHSAASDATSKLTETVAARKTELLELQLNDGATAAVAAGGAYSIARRGKTSSTQESTRYSTELQKLETKLAYHKNNQDFSKMEEIASRIESIVTKVGPCAERLSYYNAKVSEYDSIWYQRREAIQQSANALGWLPPADPARPSVIVSRRTAEGNLETIIDLVHPEYALQLEDESRRRAAEELLAKTQNTLLSLGE